MCNSPILVGLDDISAYLKRSKPVVRRMIREGELPIVLKRGAYMTSTRLLDSWLEREAQIDSQIA